MTFGHSWPQKTIELTNALLPAQKYINWRNLNWPNQQIHHLIQCWKHTNVHPLWLQQQFNICRPIKNHSAPKILHVFKAINTMHKYWTLTQTATNGQHMLSPTCWVHDEVRHRLPVSPSRTTLMQCSRVSHTYLQEPLCSRNFNDRQKLPTPPMRQTYTTDNPDAQSNAWLQDKPQPLCMGTSPQKLWLQQNTHSATRNQSTHQVTGQHGPHMPLKDGM